MAKQTKRAHAEPVAVLGMACRLPGRNNSVHAFWEFLKQARQASNAVPVSRLNIAGHRDGSKKPKTMRSVPGMYLEDVDISSFDAGFFNISRAEAMAMDPQQRQLLEVAYECIENSGIPVSTIDGTAMGCFVGSFVGDYADMMARDPEERPATVTTGIGRAILSNRISHFFNLKGTSMTIDTACSGSLVAVDLACRYLETGDIESALVAGANLNLSPEFFMDEGPMGSSMTQTGRCHAFDVRADGYAKSEGVNAVVLKRLDAAIRDGDPIRAVIRGWATNSDGHTPGITNPDADAQAACIAAAYSKAGISDYNQTGFVECHGTGTQTGDLTEAMGLAKIFAATRDENRPLVIGSVKSNVGHSEAAAGLSGLIKTVLALETGLIPGTPSFITPNPKIDFKALRLRVSRTTIPWPANTSRRASINSFGYGGTNCHIILEHPALYLSGKQGPSHISSFSSSGGSLSLDDDDPRDITYSKPYILVLSATDEASLTRNCEELTRHLADLHVQLKLPDLSYTLAARRSHHAHRAFAVVNSLNIHTHNFERGQTQFENSRIGFIFTGQGSQWPQMGKDLVRAFPRAMEIINELDKVLQSLPEAPSWSLLENLVEPYNASHIQQPGISQPSVTAIQLVLVMLLRDWNVLPQNVIGHSSGEIAAAYAAGYITKEEAITIAFYRGHAAKQLSDAESSVGMMAVGLSADDVQPYLHDMADSVFVACVNSPRSITLSGLKTSLEILREQLSSTGIFARILQVDLAYHSPFMKPIGEEYERLLQQDLHLPSCQAANVNETSMFSTLTGELISKKPDAEYWRNNMGSPVQFSQAFTAMASDSGPQFLVEIGPSNTLAGPVRQIKEKLSNSPQIEYSPALKRGEKAIGALFDLCGQLFIRGHPINLEEVNQDHGGNTVPAPIVDLPNYAWNHSFSYWHENESSKDWRFRRYLPHDLLGSKILGTPWHAPSWKKTLRLRDLPWLEDHKIGADIIFPAAGYVAMAIEAIFQATCAVHEDYTTASISQLQYRLRNVNFKRALVLDQTGERRLTLTLESGDTWRLFRTSSFDGRQWTEHCNGSIRVGYGDNKATETTNMPALEHAVPAQTWYRRFSEVGYGYGPSFEQMLQVESRTGVNQSRSIINMEAPPSAYAQSYYPVHPASFDACLQSAFPALWNGDHTTISATLLPGTIDSLVVNPQATEIKTSVSSANCTHSGRGRLEDKGSWLSDCSLHQEDGQCLLRINGLRFSAVELGTGEATPDLSYRSVWGPDPTLWPWLLEEFDKSESPTVDEVIDWVAHKHPALSVVEVNWANEDTSSLWLDDLDHSTRKGFKEYHLLLSDYQSLVRAEGVYPDQKHSLQLVVDRNDPLSGQQWSDVQLLIFKTPLVMLSDSSMQGLLSQLSEVISEDGLLVLVGQDSESELPVSRSLCFDEHGKDPIQEHESFNHVFSLQPSGASKRIELLTRTRPTKVKTAQPVSLYSFRETATMSVDLRDSLTKSNVKLKETKLGASGQQHNSIGLVVDELYAPLLSAISDQQWEEFKALFNKHSHILWVTQGAQYQVTNPESAIVHGFLRSLRAEGSGSAHIVVLDVERSNSPASHGAIATILSCLHSNPERFEHEWEFCERNGIIHISRIYPDAKPESLPGVEPARKSLADCDGRVALHASRLGSLGALQWTQEEFEETILKPGHVEVDIHAAGLNFKDVAIAMGIVRSDEYRLGHEGAGHIRRVGAQTDGYQISDRVVVLSIASFANRIQVPVQLVHRIPDTMSFEDAASMPLVYTTAVYSLLDVANLQTDQSILIHSATGGLGLACVQITQHIGAKIYATAGTEEKRDFLHQVFSIPRDRIFSSRDTQFAASIHGATQGRGIDVIINTLTGDLLHESWNLCADGGTFVELGKKDINERNSISMEPFDRTCSFRAVDLSHKQITDNMLQRLLSKTFDLINNGHVGPIHPLTTFTFNDIQTAFAHMRSARHTGKIVIAADSNPGSTVLVHSPPRPLSVSETKSYLIVGGLRGLCGSLAICLAQRGAKHLIVLSRSGCSDDRSRAVITNCASLGCNVIDAAGDVTSQEHAQNVFKSANPPIGGVIHGAMVLNDKPIETMTAADFHGTISSKVQGAWALHHAAAEQERSQPLDFFTMLSSVSGIVGQKGQANYAAANVFLDSFAAYRRSLGLVAYSVDLGVIDAVGVAAEKGGMERAFDPAHWPRIKETKLREILCTSIEEQQNTNHSQLITGLPSDISQLPILSQDARFYALCARGSQEGGRQQVNSTNTPSKELYEFRLLIKNTKSKAQLVDKAVTLCGLQLNQLLYLGDTAVDPNKSLSAYGVDSLTAIEFRNWLKKEFEIEVTTFEIIGASCLYALADKVVSKVA